MTKPLIDASQLAEVPELVASIGLREEVARPLQTLLEQMDPCHGTRWLTVADVGRSVREVMPEHAAEYDAFESRIETPGAAFTFIWVGYHLLLMYRAGALLNPGHDFIEMGQAWTRAGLDKFFENPSYQMMRKAIGNDVGDLIEVMFRDNPFFNYGSQTVHREGPRTYTCYGTETYSPWVKILLVPFAEGMFEQFGVDGTADFTALSDSSFEIVFRW